jgi:hypothetical protein
VINLAAIARMRTVAQCVEYFKEQDPETAISDYYIRQLVKKKKFLCLMTGRKMLINLDKLIEYLMSDEEEETENNTPNDFGKLRKVEA